MIGVVLAIVGGATLVLALVLFAIISAKKRREAMEALATATGWSMHRNDRQLPRRYRAFSPFGTGSNRYADWVFSADQEGFRCDVFQYHYETHHHTKNGRKTTHHYFRVLAVPMSIDAPRMSIRNENILHKLVDTFGGEDIDFESDEFSRRFWVKGDDRRFVYDVVTPGMMEFLLANRGWTWQWHGRTLIVHQSGGLRAEHVRPMVALAAGFATRIPEHLSNEGST